MEITKQRIRCNNFTTHEMECLLTLVECHKEVVESKRTDAITNGEKERDWERIAVKFNAAVGTGRTSKQLRNKWDAWKKSTKKEFSAKKNCLYKTGGGPYTDIKLDNWGDRILGIIGISASGTKNYYDSDNIGGSINNGEANTQLDLSMDLCSSEILCEIAVDEVLETNADNILEIPLEQLEDEKSEEPQCSSGNSKISDWKHWSPALLQNQINPALSQKYSDQEKTKVQLALSDRPVIASPLGKKRKRQTENATRTGNYNLLLQKKLELVELQINLLRKEHEEREKRNREKHELEIKYLESKICCNCENKRKN